MTGILKFVIRVGVIAGLALFGATLIAGPERVGMFFHQVGHQVASVIDDNVDDHVSLRNQLRKLESQFPREIKKVRSDLAEIQHQIQQVEKEQAIAERVVMLTTADMENLTGQIESIEAAPQTASHSSIRLDGRRYNLDRAYARLNQINQNRIVFSGRVEDTARELTLLDQEKERLENVLAKLETEQAQFQAQIWQLDRQVDAVARNERMIGIMEKRQRTLDELGRYQVHSLDQITSKLDQIRVRQEAEIDALSNHHAQTSYEDRARMEIDFERRNDMSDWTETSITLPESVSSIEIIQAVQR